jgi:nitrate reductase NapE component
MIQKKKKVEGTYRRPLWEWGIISLQIILAITSIAVVGGCGFILWAAQMSAGGLPPQDCMRVSYNIEGFITDVNGEPISNAMIHAWDGPRTRDAAFDFQVNSAEDGHFLTETANSFDCKPFQVEVRAEGFETMRLQYYPPLHGWPNELPDVITVQLAAISD